MIEIDWNEEAMLYTLLEMIYLQKIQAVFYRDDVRFIPYGYPKPIGSTYLTLRQVIDYFGLPFEETMVRITSGLEN